MLGRRSNSSRARKGSIDPRVPREPSIAAWVRLSRINSRIHPDNFGCVPRLMLAPYSIRLLPQLPGLGVEIINDLHVIGNKTNWGDYNIVDS